MSTSGATIDGGYEAEFCSPVPPDYICAICHLAFRSPVQLPCGHQFCKSCWEKCIKNSVATCPMDRQNIELNKVRKDLLRTIVEELYSFESLYSKLEHSFKQVWPDLAVERRVLSLLVKCSKQAEGCSWSEELRSLQIHLDTTCLFQMVECENSECDTKVKRGDVCNHVTTCIYQIVNCPHCNIGHKRQLQMTHLSSCAEAPVECTNECGVRDIPRSKLEDHMKKDCAMAILPCRYANVGCEFKEKKHLRETHEDCALKEHLLLSTNHIKSLDDKICGLQNTTCDLEDKNCGLQKKICGLEEKNRGLETKLHRLEYGNFDLHNKICELENSSNNNGNGIFWVVEDIQAKLTQARTVPGTWYKSPLFFSKSGYKLRMCLSFELGNMKLGIQLVKGKSDPILAWPFQGSYEFHLLSEGGKKKTWHVNTRTTTGYNRPTDDVIQKIVVDVNIPIQTIRNEGFFIDDTIYIKCNILTDKQDVNLLARKRKYFTP